MSLAQTSSPSLVLSSANLLLNGDLRSGSSLFPDYWRTEAWNQEPGVTSFDWLSHPDRPGELRLVNHKPNDARWVQNLTLKPGWYYLSANIRTKNVPPTNQGASLSILEDSVGSQDLRGDNEWRRVGFYLKVGPRGADIEVACRLGGFSSLNTGTAWFSDIRVVPVKEVSPKNGPAFDLDEIRRQNATPPVGRPWTMFLVFAMTIGLAAVGWATFARSASAKQIDEM